MGASAVLAGAGAVIFLTKSGGGGAAHVLTTPAKLGAYTQDPRLAQQMEAKTLQRQIIQQSGGEARNVIYGVYADDPGSAAGSGQQVFLFIGGNLSGASAGGFISSFTGRLPGAAAANPGSLGGDAACVPSENGHPAACAWADNDTFGVVTSATLSAPALADEMRHMRPLVEHQVNEG